MSPRRRTTMLVAALALVVGGCGGGVDASPAGTPTGSTSTAGLSGTIRVYTSVSQETVDAVVDAFHELAPNVEVELFRAPTGELNARIAAERRSGDVGADVLWLTDPLSMQQYSADGLLQAWTPPGIDVVPDRFRAADFFGTRVLNLVIVHQADLDDPPTAWQDLTRSWDQPVAIPDPGFAGSAFAALGYFVLSEDFGVGYYRALKSAGAVQVRSPADVVNGVAEGQYAAGLTLDRTARVARDKGSPIAIVFPSPGAIALHSPIAVLAASEAAGLAEAFAAFTITPAAQRAMAGTGYQPIRTDVAWDEQTGPVVTVDWTMAFDRQSALLEDYRSIFGG